MEIRKLRPEEMDEHLKLSQYAFQYVMSPEELERAHRTRKPEQLWVAVEEGRIRSQVLVLPLTAYVQGRKFAMGGVAAVASWPEERRKGHIAQLLRRSLEEMKERGQTLSMLAPFSIGFYRRFGWELCADRIRFTIPRDKLPPRKLTPGFIERVDPAQPDIRQSLQELYEEYASGFQIALSRESDWWDDSVLRRKSGHAAIYRSEGGAAEGYALYQVKERKLTVHELVYLSEEAREGLWTFFGQHDSMIDQVQFESYKGDPLPFLLPDPRIEQAVQPYFMARIVDAEAFIEAYPFLPGPARSWTMIVEDEHAPWNDGSWELAVDERGKGSLRKLSGQPADNGAPFAESAAAVALRGGIGSWTALFTGYAGPRELLAAGGLTGPAAELKALAERMEPRMPNLMDFF
ncbi:GNAT family N-acetyltransferase [Paenibacillus pasadenensis]|uniref:Acetyltransferase, GNAT family n=1 Tax=Paenibacillus pasadenensis TaxID=217090 RepID=A0A2N5N188_9BACL|nr:GNAT family N-acetyltransferase [Paenibacillus pasadenensis]PLT44108.1 acetyltransferase, GNAT family [Paenibacillus pasadenensis]